MKILYCLNILMILFPLLINAQVSDADFYESLKNEDLLIIDEKMSIAFTGKKADYIMVNVEKEIKCKPLTSEGLELMRNFTLPEPFDELYEPHEASIKNPNKIFDQVEVTLFEGFKETAESDSIALNIPRDIEEIRTLNHYNDRFGKVFKYIYYIEDIDIGDIIHLKYKYNFPFNKNYNHFFSCRMFLHSKHPRKSLELAISHPEKLEVDTSFNNTCTPHIEKMDNDVHYYWKAVNLPGCLDEAGSKPYLELHWFTFSLKPYELIYEQYNSFIEEFIPLWYILPLDRENKFWKAHMDHEYGTRDRDNSGYNKIAKRIKGMSPDDKTGIERLRLFQRFMADSVKYDNAYRYYNDQETHMKQHAGVELYGQKVKENNKEVVYANMILKFAKNFCSAYPSDSRYGQLSRDYFAPLNNNEMLFAALLYDDNFAYVMPKSELRRFYCEELPFYYEEIPVILIHWTDYKGPKRDFRHTVRLSNTPKTKSIDNYRKTNCLGIVNLEEGTISFTGRVSLSGQYSTLTRFNYTDGIVDSTINPVYWEKVWEFGNNPEEPIVKQVKTDYFYPFKSSVDVSFVADDLFKVNEDIVTIDLHNWIKHVIIDDFVSTPRFTDFYPDFTGSDTYAFMIDFKQPVTLLEVHEVTLNNIYGEYTFSIKQVNDSRILINSYFMVKSRSIHKYQIGNVAEIFQAIEESDDSSTKVKLN